MISESQIQEILAQYKKHGWNLRRVLLSELIEEKSAETLFGEIKIIASDLSALWFSRASFEERETWELRLLSDAPFALVEVFELDDDEATRDEIRYEMETLMSEQASKTRNRKV